jgi:hypothetical protein
MFVRGDQKQSTRMPMPNFRAYLPHSLQGDEGFIYLCDEQVEAIDTLLTKHQKLLQTSPQTRRYIISELTPGDLHSDYKTSVQRLDEFMARWIQKEEWWKCDEISVIERTVATNTSLRETIEKILVKLEHEKKVSDSCFRMWMEDAYEKSSSKPPLHSTLEWRLAKDLFVKGDIPNLLKDPVLNEFYRIQSSI